jgi:hypothetical protein
VEESANMQLFLSKGYLLSRNCLREVVATLNQAIPFQLVHEVDPQKGGAPLKVFKEELQDEARRAALFKDGVCLTEWHRTGDQQVSPRAFGTCSHKPCTLAFSCFAHRWSRSS